MRQFLPLLLSLTLAGCAVVSARGAERSGEQVAAASVTYQNPVYDHDFPDPMVLHAADGDYYAYSTQSLYDGKWVNVPVIRSKDLVHWRFVGDALPEKPSWAHTTQNFWAPHVAYRDGRYVLYYSADPDTHDGLALAIATSDSPTGPFHDIGHPLAKGHGFENIDPFPLVEDDESYLYWGSGFQPIRVRALAPDGLGFADGSETKKLVFPQSAPYENLVEGTWVVHRDGWYTMFYSGDNCCERETRYAVSAARSRSASGPFEKLAVATGRPDSVILRPSDRWIGVGHNSIVTDDAGQDWIVYHAIDPKHKFIPGTQNVRRPLLIDRVDYHDGWPEVQGGVPSTGRMPAPTVR